MIRKSLAAVSVLGSAALAVAALTTSVSAAYPTRTAPAAAPTVAAAAYPPSSTTITKVKRHGEWTTSFKMVRSTASVNAKCLVNAKAKVHVTSKGSVEVMKVVATGLPKNTEFDFFVIQVPDLPFGISWYQGDLETNKHGKASGKFIGRFQEETFTVAPNTAPAPVVHDGDANSNPATRPVHQYHLGFWFNDPADAAAAGCSNGVTPFNGEHNAGPQAMSTAQFPVLDGPLKHVKV
jgi:hypothetical protein